MAELLETKENALSIQIASDLHLEFPGTYDKMKTIVPESPVLALCGDICWSQKETYVTFLKEMSSKFKYVIVIAGNHEYYYGEYHRVNDKIKAITQAIGNNIFFLQRDCLELNDVLKDLRILGVTLWCDYPKKSFENFKEVVNDFQRIRFDKHYNPKKNISDEKKYDTNEDYIEKLPFIQPSDINKLHKEDVLWLKQEIKRAKIDGKRVIILTHHAPTDFACNGLNIDKVPVSYCTNYSSLETLFNRPVIGWFFGHTHFNADFVINNNNWHVRCATNQSGYIYQQMAQYYLRSKVVEFHENGFWNRHVDAVKFRDTKKQRNVTKQNQQEAKLQITMIEYGELMQNINIKKEYVPKDEKNRDCVVM